MEENFTQVAAEWWWERRLTGGIAICQELDPEALVSEMAEAFGRDAREVRRVAVATLGLEDFEPVVLTFDVGGERTVEEAAAMLAERSATTAGIAEKIYRALADALRQESR